MTIMTISYNYIVKYMNPCPDIEINNTVEPPNKGQLGTRHFVPCSEVILS